MRASVSCRRRRRASGDAPADAGRRGARTGALRRRSNTGRGAVSAAAGGSVAAAARDSRRAPLRRRRRKGGGVPRGEAVRRAPASPRRERAARRRLRVFFLRAEGARAVSILGPGRARVAASRRAARRGVARSSRAITTAPVSLTAQTPLAKSESYLTGRRRRHRARDRAGAGAPPRSDASKASAHLLGRRFPRPVADAWAAWRAALSRMDLSRHHRASHGHVHAATRGARVRVGSAVQLPGVLHGLVAQRNVPAVAGRRGDPAGPAR